MITSRTTLSYHTWLATDIVHGSGKAAEHFKLPYHGSKILSKASDVLKDFLERDNTGMQGLMQTRALTRTVQYAHANGKLQNVQVWNPQKWLDAQRGGC